MLSACATSFDASTLIEGHFHVVVEKRKSLCDIRIVLYDATLNTMYEGHLVRNI